MFQSGNRTPLRPQVVFRVLKALAARELLFGLRTPWAAEELGAVLAAAAPEVALALEYLRREGLVEGDEGSVRLSRSGHRQLLGR